MVFPSQSSASGVPGNTAIRAALVGTALSVRQLAHALAVAEPRPDVVGCVLHGGGGGAGDVPVAVLGTLDDGGEVLWQALRQQGVEQVLICLPAAWAVQTRQLTAELERAGLSWRVMPTLADQLAGRSMPPMTVAFDPAQLLDRQPQPLDEPLIRRTIRGRTVMITGAGGSIGSELARIVGRFEPSRLLLVERAENPLFEIDQTIRRIYPALDRAAILHDVTDAGRTQALVAAYKPNIIFHAAAHKHVPMMEDHPAHAVENNFFGTRSIADAAARNGVDRFVMISTDKAVNPSSVMGATKRLAELYIQYLNARSDTTFSMVRFGNVLGSACSVLPIWTQQLAHGGPITVTHEKMTRYFMTIPEAAGLVIQSAALSNVDNSGGGEVFLLDMGEPVRILDLAHRFIRSHGLEPEKDVPIALTGVRPGEKLFEELAYDGEDMIPTRHRAIRIWRTSPPDPAQMQQIVATFERLRVRSGVAVDGTAHGVMDDAVRRDAIVTALRAAIPEMVQSAAG